MGLANFGVREEPMRLVGSTSNPIAHFEACESSYCPGLPVEGPGSYLGRPDCVEHRVGWRGRYGFQV